MKSAYERALDRFGPVNELSDDVKAQIAEIDSLYTSKIASVEISYKEKMAQADGPDAVAELQQAMSREISNLKEKAQHKKDEIRRGA